MDNLTKKVKKVSGSIVNKKFTKDNLKTNNIKKSQTVYFSKVYVSI